MTKTADGAPLTAVSLAVEAVAILVSLEKDALVAALRPLEELVSSTSNELALLIVSQLCAGVTLGCADLLGVNAGRLVRDAGAAMTGADRL
ncbi:hypothetical protein [Aeromicrobium fastidiosum]|uniref:Uncharacterized protein n=1 Tax=Aeromicrobium fastidiosum TaxID=52699 RepID=A0A641ASG3_9ACTN|nr:hypothetical protein [Aeromicrobium fastidiosum]KAA1380173.1 hypothetical protein ESP62_002940 [Aeromicrobium fastidiosum]MBP2389712.1 hypothetical protein [Aeromicrobium fastidiosum]